MSSSALILADFFLGDSPPSAPAGWPRLPELEYWLARADRHALRTDWRNWYASALGLPAARDATDAGLAALVAAAELPGDAVPCQYWLATPLHWVAGLDTVRLHPHGLLQLAPEERQALCGEFAQTFAGSGLRMVPVPGRDLLLTAPDDGTVLPGTDDPARWLGLEPTNRLAQGRGAGALRRLVAELEMWLHGAAFNLRRRQRGELPVSMLWLWGGARAPAPAPPAVAEAGSGAWPSDAQDSVVLAIRRLAGVRAGARQIAVHWAAGHSGVRPLVELCAGEIAPRLSAWRGARSGTLQLIANDRCWTLAGRHRWRAWRRIRPWWEAMTC